MNKPIPPSLSAGRANGFLLAFLAIAGYFLVTEHRAHVMPYLPFLLLLACPLMHIFMHGGHEHGEGGRGGHGGGCCGGGDEEDKATAHEPQEGGRGEPRP